jgi:beta-lactamase class A
MTTRRDLMLSAAGLAAGCVAGSASGQSSVVARVRALEGRLGGGRLGLAAINTATSESIEYRSGERFAMASTFKWTLAAAALDAAGRGRLSLSESVSLAGVEILPTSPVTQAHVAQGSISVEELCAAICRISDNTGANLLLEKIGGPAGLTSYLRSIGDSETRLDRRELALNENAQSDPRDTTTPAAMARTAQKILAGGALASAARDKLTGWMMGAQTGLSMLRAHLPPGWRAGDKTGRGGNGSVNNVAIFWPPDGKPILAACYASEGGADTAAREAVHADIGRIIFETWG